MAAARDRCLHRDRGGAMSKKYLFIAACALALIGLIGVAVAATPTPTPTSVTQYHYLTRWGCEGTGDGQFDCASDIAVDGAGNIYVAECTMMWEDGPRGNKRIQKFTSDGTFITKWGTEGGGALDVDDAGTVYLSEGGRIKRFTSNGIPSRRGARTRPISVWAPSRSTAPGLSTRSRRTRPASSRSMQTVPSSRNGGCPGSIPFLWILMSTAEGPSTWSTWNTGS